jgi:Amt family ammonium transporter
MSRKTRLFGRLAIFAIAALIMVAFGTVVQAQDTEIADVAAMMDDIAAIKISIDTVWVLVSGFLVFFMQLGFALLETGMIRQTAAVNALLENFLEACIGALVWWVVGFGLAFGVDNGSGLFGTSLFMVGIDSADTIFYGNISILTMFFFQFAFAATASTITTGAMAERTDFIGHLIYTIVIVGVIYPIVVHWVWGGGWLSTYGFLDFAGSTVVHAVGGVIALVGAGMVGARKGKQWGKAIEPHNLGLALTGTLILWLGWFGFNPGSTLGAVGVTGLIGVVVLNTTLAAAAAALTAMFFALARTGRWDLPSTLNGSLAGLVGITAGCAFVSPLSAVIIGVVAGFIVLLWTDLLEIIKIDDAVGASSVHLACGVWGTVAIGLFADGTLLAGGARDGMAGLLAGGGIDILVTQVLGVAAVIGWTAATSLVMFGALKVVNRLRVNAKAEIDGNFIDNYEHGQTVMPDLLPPPADMPTLSRIPTGAVATPASSAAGD